MGGSSNDPFAQYMAQVATDVLGKPVTKQGSEWRYGSNGSLSVDIRKGTFKSFEDESLKGGVLDFIVAFETGINNAGQAADWMRERGFDIPKVERTERPRQEPRKAASSPKAQAPKAKPKPKNADDANGGKAAEITAKEGEWFYTDEEGEILFRVQKFRLSNGKKTFKQHRADGEGGWLTHKGNMDGVRLVPYVLHEVLEAVADGRDVYIGEGEKVADRLREAGLTATTNPMGAGKWGGDTEDGQKMAAALAPFFRGARVVIVPDNDEVGRKHARLVAKALEGVAESVHVLELPGLAAKEDAVEWFDVHGHTREELEELKAQAVPGDEYDFEPIVKSYTFDEIVRRGLQRTEYLLEGILAPGEISLLYGASGTGKSFLATNLGLAIARAAEFMGRYTKGGLVLYQAGEGKEGVGMRLMAYAQEHQCAGVPFVLITEEIDLLDTEGTDEEYGDKVGRFIAAVKQYEARLNQSAALIVLDTLNTAAPAADENTSQDMGRILQAIKRIRNETGAHVMVVHHKNAEGARARGHGSLYAGVDTAIEVNSIEENGVHSDRHAIVKKLKEAPGGERIDFELKPLEIGKDHRTGKPITSAVIVPPRAPAGGNGDRAQKGTKLPEDAKLARHIVVEAFERAKQQLPPGIRATLPPSIVHGVPYDAVLEAFTAKTPAHDRANNRAMAKRLDTRLMKLMGANVIGYRNGWVWWAE